jgi:hypothetical protein
MQSAALSDSSYLATRATEKVSGQIRTVKLHESAPFVRSDWCPILALARSSWQIYDKIAQNHEMRKVVSTPLRVGDFRMVQALP